MRQGACVLLAIFLTAGGAAAQPPATTGTAVLRAAVVSAETGTALRRAQVRAVGTVALEYLEPGNEQDPDVLERLRALATSVTVRDGERKDLTLTLRLGA